MDPSEEWIYAVDAASLQRMPTAAIELRDNKILRFKGYEVHMFEVVTPDERLRVRRDQKQRVVWKLEEPSTGDATRSRSDGFQRAGSLYSEAFVTADPEADLAAYGLDRPVMELTLQVGGRDDVPEERLSLLVGKSLPGTRTGLRQAKEQSRRVPDRGRVHCRINEMVARLRNRDVRRHAVRRSCLLATVLVAVATNPVDTGAFPVPQEEDPGFSIEVSVDRDRITVGDPFLYRVTVKSPGNSAIEWPESGTPPEGFDLLSFEHAGPLSDPAARTSICSGTNSPCTGRASIPSRPFRSIASCRMAP